jgi:quercetin dioxygenase-like cupin family protein
MRLATNAAMTATGVLLLAVTAVPSGAQTAHTGGGTIVTSQEVKWAPAPASVPKGAEAAVLYGDPSKEGPFAMRLRFPANYRLPAHTHPAPEIVTVISGTFKLGHGAQADKEKAQALPAGSFFAFPPGSQHYAFTDEPTVVQINSNGPWGINYVNANEDPRKQ